MDRWCAAPGSDSVTGNDCPTRDFTAPERLPFTDPVLGPGSAREAAFWLNAEYTYTGADGKELSGPDAGVVVPVTYLATFPDLDFEVKAVYTQGEMAIAEFVCRGTHTGELLGMAPAGRRMELHVCSAMILLGSALISSLRSL